MGPAPTTGGTGVSGHLANTRKLEVWRELIDAAPEGAAMAFVDADTWICRPLDAVWDAPFDLAYTVREGWRIPFNLGVLFLRVSPAVRAFVADWAAENRRMLLGGDETRPWRQAYGGVNQAAFGSLLAHGRLDALHVRPLPCHEWNCEDSAWAAFDPDTTRIVHLKGPLRAMALGEMSATAAMKPLVARWRDLERAVHQTGRHAG
jgi:hypothetical protein